MSKVRIVGGQWRGRAIEAPEGRGTRPTTDRTREAVASMVLSAKGLDLSGAHVLDAFAGSGALGLELVSRGADLCTLVDRDPSAVRVLRANVASLGAKDCARVVRADMTKLASAGGVPGGPFSVVLLDPPYALAARDITRLVANLQDRGALVPGALVVYEHAAEAPGLDMAALAGAKVIKERVRGITAVQLVRLGGSHE